MPNVVRPISQKFYAELNNGVDFDLNLSDFSALLKGCINENLKFETEVIVGSYVEFANWKIVYSTPSPASDIRVLKAGGGFESVFSVGDRCKLYLEGTTGNFYIGDVIQVTNDWLDLSFISSNVNLPSEGDVSESVYIANEEPSTGLEYKYGLIENDDSTSFISKLTNTEQLYRVSDISTTPLDPASTGFASGANKAWQSGSVTCQFLGQTADNNTKTTGNDTFRKYLITHEFKVSPLFLDGQEDAIQGLEEVEDYYEGTKSLKYVFECSFMNTITDPNSAKSAIWDTTKGSVGYFGESFNGFDTPYSLGQVSYFNQTISENVTQLTIGDLVRVSFSLFDSSNSFQSGDAVVLGHSAILDSTQYTFSIEEYKTLWSDETIRITIDSSAVSNDILKDAQAVLINSGQIDIVVDVSYSSLQNSRLAKGQNYILDVICQKSAQNVNTGSKTKLRVDYNTYDKNTDIQGLFFIDRFEHFEHADDYVDFNSVGKTNIICDIEEGLFSISDFYLDVAENAFLEDISFQIVAYNTITNRFNALRSVQIDLSDQVIQNKTVGDVQNIELDTTRNYALLDDDIFNKLKLTTSNLDVNNQHYQLEIGYKIPWQSWNEFLEAATIFYNKLLDNNGLNEKSDRYSNKNDYQIRVLVNANVSQNGIVTNYVHTSEEVRVYGYDEDENPPSTYLCEIETRSENGFLLENNILESGNTELRAIFTPQTTPVFTQSIDFTDVGTNWSRFAHGEKYNAVIVNSSRVPNWLLGQADDNDLFGSSSAVFNKNDPALYTSSINQILCNENLNAYYGCVSIDEYETYQISGDMFSLDSDNDLIGYVVSYTVDELGKEHCLSLVATTGGVFEGLNPAYTGDPSVNSILNASLFTAKIALVYNFARADSKVLGIFDTGEAVLGWDNVSDLSFEVKRNGADIECILKNWIIRGNTYNGTINYNLNDNIETEIFQGFNKIGFAFCSQNQGGFKNVILEVASANYYGILRIQPEFDPSDNSLITLSSHREGKEGEALKQLDGIEVKALFAWVKPSFIVKGFVDGSKIDLSKKYKLSAQIGALTTESILPSDFSDDFSIDFS